MTPGTRVPESYVQLLVRLQPRSIKSDEEAAVIQRYIDALVDQGELYQDEQEVLSLLGDLLQAWEGNTYDLPPAAPSAVLRALLEAHGMQQCDLVGLVFATKSIASEVLSGKRRLTYDQVQRLARVFHVSPAVFYANE